MGKTNKSQLVENAMKRRNNEDEDLEVQAQIQKENKTNDETNNYVRVRKDKYNLPKTENDKMLVRMPPIFRGKLIKYAEILTEQNPQRRKVSQTEALLTILDEFFKRNKI